MHRICSLLLLVVLWLMTPSPVHAQDAASSSAKTPASSSEAPTPSDNDEEEAAEAASDDSDDEVSEDDEAPDSDEGDSSPSAPEAGESFASPLTTLLHTPVDITSGFAVNPFFMPAIQTKLGVRFPWTAFNWGLTAGYSYGPIHMLFPGQEPLPQHVSLGFQWYVLDLTFAQLYCNMTGGYLFQTAHRTGGATVPLAGVPTVMAGAGLAIGTPIALGWLPPTALNVSLDVGYPFIIRPEFSLRLTI